MASEDSHNLAATDAAQAQKKQDPQGQIPDWVPGDLPDDKKKDFMEAVKKAYESDNTQFDFNGRVYKITEKLTGDQDKLDVNNNDKIDSDDLAKLRGEKEMDEHHLENEIETPGQTQYPGSGIEDVNDDEIIDGEDKAEMPASKVNEATDYHAVALKASDHAKNQPSATTHKAASAAHEKAIAWHERKVNGLIKKDGSAEEVKKHETHIKMHKNEAQKHRFNAHRLEKKAVKEGIDNTIDEAYSAETARSMKSALRASERADKSGSPEHHEIAMYRHKDVMGRLIGRALKHESNPYEKHRAAYTRHHDVVHAHMVAQNESVSGVKEDHRGPMGTDVPYKKGDEKHARTAPKEAIAAFAASSVAGESKKPADHAAAYKAHKLAAHAAQESGDKYRAQMHHDEAGPHLAKSGGLVKDQVKESIDDLTEEMKDILNENIAGDSHAFHLSQSANRASAVAHSGPAVSTDTGKPAHMVAMHAHQNAAEHYRVYAHHAGDPTIRNAASIHHKFHTDMAQHHMLRDLEQDPDLQIKKESVTEGAPADAKGGPEVMDPKTKKMKDDAEKNIKIEDAPYTNKADGSENIIPADKPKPNPTLKKENMDTVKSIRTVADAYRTMNTPASGISAEATSADPVFEEMESVLQNEAAYIEEANKKAAANLPEKPKNPHSKNSALYHSHEADHLTKVAKHFSKIANKSDKDSDHKRAMHAHDNASFSHVKAYHTHLQGTDKGDHINKERGAKGVTSGHSAALARKHDRMAEHHIGESSDHMFRGDIY